VSTRTLPAADKQERMPDNDLVETELDEGHPVTRPLPGGADGYIGAEIGAELRTFAKTHNLGRVYSNTGFRLSQDTVRVPDVAFVCEKRVPVIHREGFLKGAPDLAVEVFPGWIPPAS
jgi:Uma2 family endonuclease